MEVQEELYLDKNPDVYAGLKDNIRKAVENGRPLILRSYSVSDDVEVKLDAVIHMILSKFDKLDYKPLVYTITKELIINGTRANHKRIFFDEKNLTIEKEEDYVQGVHDFRVLLREEHLYRFGKIARDRGLRVDSKFTYDENHLYVEVSNNVSIAPPEESRLRHKLEDALKYESMVDFFMNHADAQEGAGLGLAMSITMLRSEGMDPKSLQIHSADGETVAQIDFQFP